MIVKLHVTGYMRTHLRNDHYLVELESDYSTLVDFYEKIDSILEEKLSNAVWNNQKKRFQGPVIIKVDGEIVRQDNYNLKDGQTIEISRLLIGG